MSCLLRYQVGVKLSGFFLYSSRSYRACSSPGRPRSEALKLEGLFVAMNFDFLVALVVAARGQKAKTFVKPIG